MNVMEDNRAEQKEALEVLIEFNDRVLKNMNIIVKEQVAFFVLIL